MKRSSTRLFTDRLAATVARAVALGTSSLHLVYKPDEIYRVPTDDGAAISLGRYHARGRRLFLEPVVLCHGLGANRFNLDFDDRYSVARYLARRGFETWVMELRGRGLAGPAAEATFDLQAEYDARAALRTIRATGAPAATWVGHSKGGLIAYGHLARNPQAPIRAMVTIGTPATFHVQHGLKKFLRTISPLLRLKVIPSSKLAALAPLGAPPGPITRYMMLGSNVDLDVQRRAIASVTSDIAGGVARQFARWAEKGTFDSSDGLFDYRRNLAAIHHPVFLIAGSRDLMAPPAAVFEAVKQLGGPVETWIAGKSQGLANDYGHSDLVVGREAPTEIFPRIEAFLAAHSTPM